MRSDRGKERDIYGVITILPKLMDLIKKIINRLWC